MKNEVLREFLRERIPMGPNGLATDVLFALREAADINDAQTSNVNSPILEDLRSKAQLAESTHDPENIKNLLDSLNAYLNEELHEDPEDVLNHDEAGGGDANMKDPNKPDEGTPEEEQTETPEEEQQEQVGDLPSAATATAAGAGVSVKGAIRNKIKSTFMEAIDEVLSDEGGGEDVMTEDGATTGAAEGPISEGGNSNTIMCEACGHEMALPEAHDAAAAGGDSAGGAAPAKKPFPAKKEAGATTGAAAPPAKESSTNAPPDDLEEAKKEKKMKESAQEMTDTERAELLTLRAEKRERDLLSRAYKAIRESGSLLEPKELIGFQEAQWPAVLKMAQRGEPAVIGTTENEYVPLRESDTPAGQTRPTSARDFFERSLQ